MNIIINTLLELLNRASIKQFLYILYDTKRQNIYKNKSLYKNQIKKNYSSTFFYLYFYTSFFYILFLLIPPYIFHFQKQHQKLFHSRLIFHFHVVSHF